MGCFITLSSEMALFSKKISQANIVTWTNLKNISVNINNASLVTFMSSYDPGIIVNNSFSDEYFKNHRNRVVKIDNRLKELLRNKSVLDNAKSDTTIISNIQPLLKDYIIEKINLERMIFNSRLTNDYTETTAKIAQMEIDYAICYLLLIYQYHLLKEKERINYIIDFLEIQKKYITCRDAWIKSKS
jgi:hypothetical protein